MKLRELFENKGNSVGVCFGRWNPPHKGHRAAWEIAANFGTFYVGTNKNTEGPNDPLPYEVKLKAMETIWPEIAGHVIPEQSLFTLVSKVFAKHGEDTHLKIATDEEWLTKSLIQYNGKEGAHGYYKFASIEQVPTPRLSSATALRAAVRAGDRDGFSDAAGVDADTSISIGKKAVAFFDLVAHYLSKHPEKVKKSKSVKETNQQLRQRKNELVEAQKLSKVEREAGVFAKRYDSLDTYYDMYRLGVTIAGGDAHPVIGHGPNSDSPSVWMYTPQEAEKVAKAEKRQGIKGTTIIGKGQSSELDSTNKKSTTAVRKPNKYGV
jgi:hypothetical protein